MSSRNFLNFKFCSLKLCIKYNRIEHIVNNTLLAQNLTCVLRAQRTCNPMIKFSKYVKILTILSNVVALGYDEFCNQILFIFFNQLNINFLLVQLCMTISTIYFSH